MCLVSVALVPLFLFSLESVIQQVQKLVLAEKGFEVMRRKTSYIYQAFFFLQEAKTLRIWDVLHIAESMDQTILMCQHMFLCFTILDLVVCYSLWQAGMEVDIVANGGIMLFTI